MHKIYAYIYINIYLTSYLYNTKHTVIPSTYYISHLCEEFFYVSM